MVQINIQAEGRGIMRTYSTIGESCHTKPNALGIVYRFIPRHPLVNSVFRTKIFPRVCRHHVYLVSREGPKSTRTSWTTVEKLELEL